MGRFFEELKRRNVFRVAIAYIVVAWLVLQVGDALAPALRLPDWVNSVLAFFLILGLPIAIFFAWAFELTPEGIKPEKEVDRSNSISKVTGRKLDFIIIGVLSIAVVVFAMDKFGFGPDSVLSGSESQASVAVLPFIDMSPNKDQEYFSDGISEELLNQLTKLRGLHVAGRTSSFFFKGKDDDLRIIGEKLNVAHILEGSVRKAGDRVRITVQLIKASDGYHLWSQTYDRDLNDIFAIQEETAKAVADALSVTLGVGDTRFDSGGTRNFEAYDLLLSARSLMTRQGAENFREAIRLLENAVALDPEYADAWSLLATAYGAGGSVFISERAEELLPKARQAAARAAEVAPDSFASLGAAAGQHMRDGNWIEAERMFKKMLERAPGAIGPQAGYGFFLEVVGRTSEAIKYLRQAVEIEPLLLSTSLQLALALQTNGDSDEAFREFERGKSLIGNHVLLNGSIVVFALETHDRELIGRYLDIIENDPASGPVGHKFTRTISAVLDSPEAARAELRRAYGDPIYDSPLSRGVIATYAAYFGDQELALEIFHELEDAGVLSTETLWRPVYKNTRCLPGFKDLMRKAGLLDYWRDSGHWGDFCRPLGHDDFECD